MAERVHVSCVPLPGEPGTGYEATGGYECEFVAAVPDCLSCPVCLLPFRDPHLLDCCGAKYCAVCIGRVKAAGRPCPLCNEQQFTTMLDKNDRRKVLSLMVRCSKKKNGCDWEGELRHLEHHQMEECGWALVKCRYECGVCVPRPQLVEHELRLCPKRPVDVKLESAMTKMEERHEREMDTVKQEFRREIEKKLIDVKNYFKSELQREVMKKEQEITAVKAELKREIKKKGQELAALKVELKREKEQEIAALKVDFRRQIIRGEQVTEKKLAEQRKEYTSKMKVMEESLVKLTQEMRVHLSLPLCELVMTDYSKYKTDDKEWYSPPFHTGPGGYKMCLRVYANGYGDGADTHVSVFVSLM